MNKEEFIKYLRDINIEITDYQLNQLNEYYQLLIKWNEKINLTAIVKEEDVYLKHFYDSLTINKIVKIEDQLICDIGTGAGFPGIVLKIFFPKTKMVLVESLTKRCRFLKEVIRVLKIQDIEVINERAEIYSKKTREKFDIVLSRAVAKTNELLEYSIPLLKIKGICIAMKSQEEEINKRIYLVLNINKIKTMEFYLPKENSKRTLTIYQKKAKTNLLYPRNYANIKKQPL